MNNNNAPQGLLFSMIFGGIFFLAGAFIVMISADIIHADPSSFHAPRWVVGAAGGVFMLAGTMVAIQGSFGPEGMQTKLYLWLQFLLGLAFMALFSSIFLWVGFGPGEREFSTSTSIGFISTSGSGNVSTGRLIFGTAGLLMVFFTVAMAISNLRKLFK